MWGKRREASLLQVVIQTQAKHPSHLLGYIWLEGEVFLEGADFIGTLFRASFNTTQTCHLSGERRVSKYDQENKLNESNKRTRQSQHIMVPFTLRKRMKVMGRVVRESLPIIMNVIFSTICQIQIMGV